jgi:hypothetical protein
MAKKDRAEGHSAGAIGRIRDRIKEFRRVPAELLKPSRLNFRRHPEQQRSAMRAILTEIGYAGAALARELPDGSLELIDGHLRSEESKGQMVPTLILDVTAEEADALVALYDPIGDLARVRRERRSFGGMTTSSAGPLRGLRTVLGYTSSSADACTPMPRSLRHPHARGITQFDIYR